MSEMEKLPQIECPECGHVWVEEDERIQAAIYAAVTDWRWAYSLATNERSHGGMNA